MNANDTIRLLVLNDARAEVERMISMLNNAGHPTRSQHVESVEALTKLLQDNTWDLLLAQDNCKQVPPNEAIRQIRRLNKDVPVVLITDEDGNQVVVNGLKLGANDVVRLDEDQHLLLVIQRELTNRRQRQQRRLADQKLRTAERRSQQLLDSSKDAIAFVQDGMYLYANQSYAERFGHDDRDEIECMPIIDMVSDDDQGPVKQFLKDFTLKGEEVVESSQFTFNAILGDGQEAPITVDFSSAVYDEEPCIQFFIPAQQHSADNELLQAELQKMKHLDQVTGLYNRPSLVERLEHVVSDAVSNQTSACLLYIELDNYFEHIQPLMGVAATDNVLRDLATLLQPFADPKDTLARLSDDAFALLTPSLKADSGLEKAKAICKALENHIIDVEGKTAQSTCTVGLSYINEASPSADECMEQAMRAIHDFRTENSNKGNGAKLFEPEISEDDQLVADDNHSIELALKNNRFKLLFQPIISLRGAEDELYEVLLRLVDEHDELLSPSKFMSTASETGAMTKIDRWVILETIKALAEHRSHGHNTRALVNLSKDSLCDSSLAPWLEVAFKAAKLTPSALIFQVDEMNVTQHLNNAKTFFSALNQMQAKTSISNFGCSLNPFLTLEHAPSDYVKINGSFTQDIQHNNESPDTLKALIKQLLEADKITVVPFVENSNVLAALWQTGVHYIQGHYLQAPAKSMDYDFNMEG